MNVTRDEWDKEEAGVWVLNWVVRRLPQCISVCNMQWECQEWVFFTSDWVPCHNVCCFKWCLINRKSLMPRTDYIDKDSIQPYKSPNIFTTIAVWISSKQFKLSSETMSTIQQLMCHEIFVFKEIFQRGKPLHSIDVFGVCHHTVQVNRDLALYAWHISMMKQMSTQ